MPTKLLLFQTFAFILPWKVRGTRYAPGSRYWDPQPCPFSDAQLRNITIQSTSWEHAFDAIGALEGCGSRLGATQELSIKITASQEVYQVPVPQQQRPIRSTQSEDVRQLFDMALTAAMAVNRPPHTHSQQSYLLQDRDPHQKSPPRRPPLLSGPTRKVRLQLRKQAPPVSFTTSLTNILRDMHALESLTLQLPNQEHGAVSADSIELWVVEMPSIKHLTLSPGLERLIKISPNVKSVTGVGHFTHKAAQRLTLACGCAKMLRNFSMSTRWTAQQLDLILAIMLRLQELNMSGTLEDDLHDFLPILARFTKMRSLRLPQIGHAGAPASSISSQTASRAALLVRKRRRAEREVSEKVSWAMRAGVLRRLWLGHCEVKLGRYGKHKA